MVDLNHMVRHKIDGAEKRRKIDENLSVASVVFHSVHQAREAADQDSRHEEMGRSRSISRARSRGMEETKTHSGERMTES